MLHQAPHAALTQVTSFDPKTFIAGLPQLPGVYRMLDKEGQVLYVGKAIKLKRRVSSYFQKTNLAPRIRLMVSQIANIEITLTPTDAEALILENNLIKSLKPRYNILFRDDKTYPYIVLTQHEYPRLAYHRGTVANQNQHFGPYPNLYAAKDTINLVQRIFRLRTCEDSVFSHRTRACLLHQIHRCTAPCVGLISKEDYAADLHKAVILLQGKHNEVEKQLTQAMESASEQLFFEKAAVYRDQLQALHTVQQKQIMDNGRGIDLDIVVAVELNGILVVNLAMIRGGRHLGDKNIFPQNASNLTTSEVLEAFLAQHYLDRHAPSLILTDAALDTRALESLLSEQAGYKVQIKPGHRGERKLWVDMSRKNALLAIQQQIAQQSSQALRRDALKEILKVAQLERIECFDISHTMGEATVASCVVYDNLSMRNSEYRRFNITGITPGDDYAAMRQALTRRYQKILTGEGKRPDLLLIDGGKGQLGIAYEVIQELGLSDIQLMGVAKGELRKPGLEQLIIPGQEKPLQLSPDSPALHLIQQIRDEAHRFAISGHRARRGKARTASMLEEISGVGERRRRNLLAHFGGLQGVKQASVDQLAQVDGISRALAEKIHQQLH